MAARLRCQGAILPVGFQTILLVCRRSRLPPVALGGAAIPPSGFRPPLSCSRATMGDPRNPPRSGRRRGCDDWSRAFCRAGPLDALCVFVCVFRVKVMEALPSAAAWRPSQESVQRVYLGRTSRGRPFILPMRVQDNVRRAGFASLQVCWAPRPICRALVCKEAKAWPALWVHLFGAVPHASSGG